MLPGLVPITYALMVLLLVDPPNDPDSVSGTVIHRAVIEGDRELLVVKGRAVPSSRLHGLVSQDVTDPTSGFFNLSVVLRSTSTDSLILWSDSSPLHLDSDYEEVGVLDLLVLSNRLVVTFSGPFSSIGVIEIGLYGPDRFTSLRGIDWSLLGAALPVSPPGRLHAKLSYNEEEKRVQVEVTDSLQGTEQHTLFEQKGGQWEFVRVNQWQQPVPSIDLKAIPQVEDIRDVKLTETLNAGQDGPALTPKQFKHLIESARPITTDDPSIAGWSYAPWYSGTFVTNEGTYKFQLFLGGRGRLTTPAGTTGIFSFDRAKAQDQPADDE